MQIMLRNGRNNGINNTYFPNAMQLLVMLLACSPCFECVSTIIGFQSRLSVSLGLECCLCHKDKHAHSALRFHGVFAVTST